MPTDASFLHLAEIDAVRSTFGLLGSRLAALISGIRDLVLRRVSLGDLVARMVAFVRAGYPQHRRLSHDEIVGVVFELARRGAKPLDATDIRVAISEFTGEMPSPADTDRVRRRLESAGWLVIDDLPNAAG